jgi:NitT/TauT family transport system substrate-binding protein/putative hydroxymethylpyrimidine transport system substrate-binding protein
MKKTSKSVPMNSAMYAAGPRSCTFNLLWLTDRLHVGFDVVRRIPLVIALIALLAGCDSQGEEPAGVGRIALDFQPNAVHAGLLSSSPIVPSSSTDSLKLLLGRRVDMSVVDIHDLGLARERGEDIVGVGAVVQRPLAAVIAKSQIERPRDLEGKRVGVTGLPSDDAVLRAVVEHDGGDFDKVRRTTIGFTAVPSLIAGKVDAVVAFWNAEGVALRQRGVKTREFRVDDYGAPRYPELVLAVRGATWRERHDEVETTLGCLRHDTIAALRDRRATIDALVKASGADEDLMRAELDAVGPALVPPIRLDRHALEQWARFDTSFGILKQPPDVDEAFPR